MQKVNFFNIHSAAYFAFPLDSAPPQDSRTTRTALATPMTVTDE